MKSLFFLLIGVFLSASFSATAATQLNHIVICICFSDSHNMTHDFNTVNGMLNTDPNNNLRDYFQTMSYGKVDIVSHFYPPANGTTLRFYKDSNTSKHYMPISEKNPQGYRTYWDATIRENSLLCDAVNWVNQNYPVSPEINLDFNNDNICDYITFIVSGTVNDESVILKNHRSSISFGTTQTSINSKIVLNYNFMMDDSPDSFNVGVFCHDGFHILGAPDMYHLYFFKDISPVGYWDIMGDSIHANPQSMSAYMKYKYGKWIPSLPVATLNKTYEIFPYSSNDGTDPNKLIIYRIPMLGLDQRAYCVVEYRKKTGLFYDSELPSDGLMIYRITPLFTGNALFGDPTTGLLDEVFLYRPGCTYPEMGFAGAYTQGDLSQAPFLAENGRTEFNSTTDPKPDLLLGGEVDLLNINHILYDNETDSYTFFYGEPENMKMILNKNELTIGKQTGALGTVTIVSNILWRVSIPDEAKSWLAVSKTKGINRERIVFSALADNNTGLPISANVLITGNGDTLIVNVTQDIVETFCVDEVSDLQVNIELDKKLATLSWNLPSEEEKAKTPKMMLWDNTLLETGKGSRSTRWLDGNDRIVLADDFDVPEDETWSIEEIYCNGWQFGTSPLPDYIGIAIYNDNGKKCPQKIPIFEKADFIPIEGVTSGKMHLSLSDPIVISQAGKYWISIYGTFEGKYDKSRFDFALTSKEIGERLHLWDQTGRLQNHFYYPDWGPVYFGTGYDMCYGLSFSMTGTITYPDQILYNIYLDGELIATDLKNTNYLYPKQIATSKDHLWCVSALCTSYIEGNEVCFQTAGVENEVRVCANNQAGGSFSGDGNYEHGDHVTLSAHCNPNYIFTHWSVEDMLVSSEESYSFIVTENISFVAHFRRADFISFDSYVVTKWNNTFMLNLNKLQTDNIDYSDCKWFRNNELIGSGFTYSAGNKSTDLLEIGAVYTFEIVTTAQDTLISTPKVIYSFPPQHLKVYPNPVSQGNRCTIEGADEGSIIEIFNLQGRCISCAKVTGKEMELTLNFPPDIYFLRVNEQATLLIIKK